MKRTLLLMAVLASGFLVAKAKSIDPATTLVRPAPEWLTQGVIYQVWLRAFTPEGTLKAATERLPQVAALGATIVYLPPVYLQDDDMRREYWSRRQKSCGANNPRNPYRIKDYDRIDPEYGTEAKLKAFIAEAHRLGLHVLMDLVYFHCGPTCVLSQRPGFLKTDAQGQPLIGPWGFPTPDFDNPLLREYFIANMLYWVKDCGADGFRGDVSDLVPLDFWEAARKRLEAVKPDVVMLGEGDGARPENQVAAFDIDYALGWHAALCEVMAGKKTALELKTVWESYRKGRPQGVRFIRYTDHHDSAHGPIRVEKLWGYAGADAALVLTFTLDGVPFLYNGQEIADDAPHSIYQRMPIDWLQAKTPTAQTRFSLCEKLCALRKTEAALTSGRVDWIDTDASAGVLSFLRETEKEAILTLVNLTSQPVRVRLHKKGLAQFTPLVSFGYNGVASELDDGCLSLAGYGYFVGKSIAQ